MTMTSASYPMQLLLNAREAVKAEPVMNEEQQMAKAQRLHELGIAIRILKTNKHPYWGRYRAPIVRPDNKFHE